MILRALAALGLAGAIAFAPMRAAAAPVASDPPVATPSAPETEAGDTDTDPDAESPEDVDAEPADEAAPDDGAPDDDTAPDDDAAAGSGSEPTSHDATGTGDVTPEPSARGSSRPKVTSPTADAVRHAKTRVLVGVGLAPSAPGSKAERVLLEQLERTIAASPDPKAKVRHVSAGAGDPRLVCRERRDDLVVMIGYVAERSDPVVLVHDCRLDRALGLRSQAAVRSEGLLGALWEEHETLVRQGVRERRGIRRLTPTARGVIIASVAVAVVGVAVGILVANALRDEKVVITVSP